MEEKRKYKRVPVDAIILYQIEDYENMPEGNLSRVRSPLSVDISVGGIKIETDQKLPEGTYLKITLSIVPSKVSVDVIGKVAWTKDSQTENHYNTGIEFVEFIIKTQKKLIEDYVNKED